MRKQILNFFLFILSFFDKLNNKIFFSKIKRLPQLREISLIDIGSSYDIQPRWKKIKKILNYHGFEPNSELHQNLKNKNTDCLSYNIYPFLISEKKEIISLNICDNPGVSSIFKPNFLFLSKFKDHKRFNINKKISLEANNLDSLNLKSSDFIKIDIQGAELKALNGSLKTLDNTLGLEIEVEFQKMYENQPIFGDIHKFLDDKEFELIDFPIIKRWEREEENSFGQIVFADALFLRSPEFANENFNSSKMAKYILILLLYNKFDLIDACNLKKFFSDEEVYEIRIVTKYFKNKNLIARYINSISTGFSKLLGNEYKSHLFH